MRGSGGRPPHIPTTEQKAAVVALASYGTPQSEIAEYIGIDAKTLRKTYREELDKSATKANTKVVAFLYRAASGDALRDQNSGATFADCLRAAMFWTKTRMGWRETSRHELTGPDGAPIQTISADMTAEDAAEAYMLTLTATVAEPADE